MQAPEAVEIVRTAGIAEATGAVVEDVREVAAGVDAGAADVTVVAAVAGTGAAMAEVAAGIKTRTLIYRDKTIKSCDFGCGSFSWIRGNAGCHGEEFSRARKKCSGGKLRSKADAALSAKGFAVNAWGKIPDPGAKHSRLCGYKLG